MAEQPTRGGADSGPPAADRPSGSSRTSDGAPAAPLTVAELLARSGNEVRNRRAARRESGDATGRQDAVRADGSPGVDRPPLRGGIRRDPASSPGMRPPVLPTGWQPAMPATQPPAAEPAGPAPRTVPPRTTPPRSDQPRTTPPGTTPPRTTPPRTTPPAGAQPPVGRAATAPPSIWTPPPSVPRSPAPSAPPASPPATPPVVPVARVVPPVSVTPAAPAPSAPARPTPAAPTPPSAATPTPTPAPPRPAGLPAAPLPYASAPVPGVRHSRPLPPIPGRDLPAPGDAPEAVPARVKPPLTPGRRRLRRAALAVVTLLGLVVAYYVGLYFYADRALDRVDALVTDGPEVLAPQLQADAQTYLVVGTGLPGRTGAAAVSTLIAHVSADGDHAVLVTVPPTALNDTPTCLRNDGEVRSAVTETVASALLDGGPSCLVRSVQQLTGLRVDHYLAVDLARLPGMVGALGGVPVCPTTGSTELTGDDVRGYLGDTGLDVTGTGSAQRQEQVLTSALHTALSGGGLTDPLSLTRFLGRAGDALTVDADTTLADLRALGATLGSLSGDQVERAEVPVAQVGYLPAGSDQAAVVVDGTGTRALFDAVIDSGRLPVAADTAEPAATAPSADATTDSEGAGAADALPDPTLTDPVPEGTTVSVAPAGVTVDVLDGTGGGLTAPAADGLAAQGFVVRARGVEPAAVARTVVRYGPAALEPARTVAAAVPGSLLVESDAVGGAVQLVVGPDFTGVTPVAIGTPVPTTAAPTPVETGAGAAASCS